MQVRILCCLLVCVSWASLNAMDLRKLREDQARHYQEHLRRERLKSGYDRALREKDIDWLESNSDALIETGIVYGDAIYSQKKQVMSALFDEASERGDEEWISRYS